jgi:hypothetical protein
MITRPRRRSIISYNRVIISKYSTFFKIVYDTLAGSVKNK